MEEDQAEVVVDHHQEEDPVEVCSAEVHQDLLLLPQDQLPDQHQPSQPQLPQPQEVVWVQDSEV